jgi:hypothetical protein
LEDIRTSDQSEVTSRADADYRTRMGIWAKVAETRGVQLVADGYLSEKERLKAVEDYYNWMETDGNRMEMYILSVEGRKPFGGSH